ncbi:transglutaminase-like cysteine peptidase [Tianweitania sediminis]|uniref:Transglutaminase-like cysteine peptidase n=1 Tax=Tianweitania sediminis TaxID=1502156 RepID=A0A8J7R3R7_9HYPH|nr:transglutaminase-like cysteine peptidase [Tianweitania sediminis]
MRTNVGRRSGSFAVGAILSVLFSIAPALADSAMEVGRLTSQPIGHYEFCQSNPDECSITTIAPKREKLTDSMWRKIVSVNAAINRQVRPVSDMELYGVEEFWTYPVNGAGDCEEYVLAKQLELRNAGLSMSNLLITVLRQRNGEGHAVLTVRTDKGDFVLDNLNEKVVEWHNTDYTYLKIQSSRHSGKWVSITNADVPMTATVR